LQGLDTVSKLFKLPVLSLSNPIRLLTQGLTHGECGLLDISELVNHTNVEKAKFIAEPLFRLLDRSNKMFLHFGHLVFYARQLVIKSFEARLHLGRQLISYLGYL